MLTITKKLNVEPSTKTNTSCCTSESLKTVESVDNDTHAVIFRVKMTWRYRLRTLNKWNYRSECGFSVSMTFTIQWISSRVVFKYIYRKTKCDEIHTTFVLCESSWLSYQKFCLLEIKSIFLSHITITDIICADIQQKFPKLHGIFVREIFGSESGDFFK